MVTLVDCLEHFTERSVQNHLFRKTCDKHKLVLCYYIVGPLDRSSFSLFVDILIKYKDSKLRKSVYCIAVNLTSQVSCQLTKHFFPLADLSQMDCCNLVYTFKNQVST